MSIRLLALDIDGTLAENSTAGVPARNLAAIRAAQEKGVFVTVATGRSCVSSKTFWEQLHIEGPSIQFGGAWIVDTRDGSLLYEQNLDVALVAEIIDFAHETGYNFQVYMGDTILAERLDPHYEKFIRNNALPFCIDPHLRDRRFEAGVPKVLVFAEAAAEPRVRKLFSDRFSGRAHVTRSQGTFIEINAPAVDKGTALSYLAGMLRVDRSEVAAIGDSYLDSDMIAWAGTGVCVEDGVPEVKAAADLIVPSCADCGVAYYIERYIL